MRRVIYSVIGHKVPRPERYEVQIYHDGSWRGVYPFKKPKKAKLLADFLSYAFEAVRVEDLGE